MLLYARELATRYGGQAVLAVSVHPGVFKTGLIGNLGWGQRAFIAVTNAGRFGDEKEMSSNACWGEATSSREAIENGGFYTPVGVKGKRARKNENMELARK
jgi:hypothetical protein